MGVASISAHKKFAFRIDPYDIGWSYQLRTHVDYTYGGKVVQLLGVSLGDLNLSIVTGKAGLTEAKRVMAFFKEMALWQQNGQKLATFSYPPKKYNLKIWAKNITMENSVTNVVFPINMSFAIQEDLGGTLTKTSMKKELSKLASGVGYYNSQYNDPENKVNAALNKQNADTNGSGPLTSANVASGSDKSLSADQLSNARAIINVAFSRGLGVQGAVIGVMTAITESTLHNVNYGDYPASMGGAMSSSRGLFQQISAWGPLSVRMDPQGSAGLFFDALVRINNWQMLSPWVAAQAVQQSEFSDGSNYKGNLSWAQSIVRNITGQG